VGDGSEVLRQVPRQALDDRGHRGADPSIDDAADLGLDDLGEIRHPAPPLW